MDELKPYLLQVGKSALLKAEEEIELGRKIKCGDVVARNALVRSNLRLVVSIAKRFANQGLDMEDLVQEGNIGLVQAANKFDPTLGNRFSTYATWWIRQAVMRAIANKSRNIRLPLHTRAQLSKIKRAIREKLQSSGIQPSAQELAEITEISEEEVSRLLAALVNTISLDDGGENGRVMDLVDPDSNVEERAQSAMLRKVVDKLTRTLTPLESRTVSFLYGLDGIVGDTRMVAGLLNIDVQEVRRIQKRTLKRMRRQLFYNNVDDFV